MAFSDSQFDGLKQQSWNGDLNATVNSESWICGYCNNQVASSTGAWSSDNLGPYAYVRICTHCHGPTFFVRGLGYSPAPLPGKSVEHVPSDLASLFHEARAAAASGAHTAAVLACRKMLMNIAVAEGASEGKSFASYVQYLASNGFVPPKGKAWVDYIRSRGNEATHEIALMGQADSIALIAFTEGLLRFIYEFPNKIPTHVTSKEG